MNVKKNMVEDLAGYIMSTLIHIIEVHISAFVSNVSVMTHKMGSFDQTEHVSESAVGRDFFTHAPAHTLSDLWGEKKN